MARTALLRLEALLTGSHDLKLSAIEIEPSTFNRTESATDGLNTVEYHIEEVKNEYCA